MLDRTTKTIGIAIFVKTPGCSPVKTRLAAGIGTPLAEEFYTRSVQTIEALVSQAIERPELTVTPYWAVAEDDQSAIKQWTGFRVVNQGNGSLGDRLNFVYQQLKAKHDIVILIGADSPQMTPEHLTQPIEKLLRCSGPTVTIGRALDGGFYLFGCNASIPKEIWLKPTYSSATTCSELVLSLSHNHLIMELESLRDVDTKADLTELMRELYFSDSKLAEQESLQEWLQTISF